MLSKNNNKELMRKQEPKKQRFAIKKLTVGVASVLIGFTFMGLSVSAHADDATPATSATTEVASTQGNASAASDQSQKTVASAATNQSSAVPTTNQSSAAANTQTVNISDLGQGNAASLTESKAEGQNVNLNSTDNLTNFQNFSKAFVNKDVSTITLDSDLDLSGLTTSQADVGGASLWTGGTVGGYHGTGLGAYELAAGTITNPSTFKGIARNLTIDLNGHTLNMGKWFISLWNGNYSDGNGWNIVIKNGTLEADDTTGGYSPIHFNGVGANGVSAANAALSSIIYDGVTANLTDATLADTGANVATTINNVTATVNNGSLVNTNADVTFTGTNVVNNINDSMGYNTVKAGHVSIASGMTTLNMKVNGSVVAPTSSNGNLILTTEADGATQPTVYIAEGATLNLNGQSDNVRGIVANNWSRSNGTVSVAGSLNANMQKGHSNAITAVNLDIASTGNVVINTKQDNQVDGVENSVANQNTNYDGTHYAPISLGVGEAGEQAVPSHQNLSLTDDGSLTITRDNTGKTMTPLISFGIGSGALGGDLDYATYDMTVGNGATLDLKDNATPMDNGLLGNEGHYTNTPKHGLITMWGDASHASLNFNQPGYVNLQRTGSSTGGMILIQSKVNSTNLTGTEPVAQWDEANKTDTPSFVWYINDLKTYNNAADFADTGFTAAGNTAASTGTGVDKLINSNATVIMGANQAGKNSFKFDGTQTTAANRIIQGTPTNGKYADYEVPYLNQFLNNFSWWTPQRITMGEKTSANDAEKYQPETQTINGTTSQTLNDLTAKNGIKDLIDASGNVTTDLSPISSVDWYNSSTDKTVWENQMKNSDGTAMAEPSNPTGNLKTTDTSAWAKVTYGDGSVDFVNIPLNITDTPETNDAEDYTPTYPDSKGLNDKPQYVTPTVTDKSGNTVSDPSTIVNSNSGFVITDPTKAPSGTTINPSTGEITIPANATPGDYEIPVTVTYKDGSQDNTTAKVTVDDVPAVKGIVANNDGSIPDPSTGITNYNNGGTTPVPGYPSKVTWTTTPTVDPSNPGITSGEATVTYPDGTTTQVSIPITVTGDDHKGTYYGDQSMTQYEGSVPVYHKTTGSNSISDTDASISKFQTITYNYDWDHTSGNGHYKSYKTYKLNAAGTGYYLAEEGTQTDSGANRTALHSYTEANTPEKYDNVNANWTWRTDAGKKFVPSTNVDAFNGNTGDTLYKNADGTVNSDEQTDSTDPTGLSGNSKWRVNYTIGDRSFLSAIGLPSSYSTNGTWYNAYFDFLGATAKTGLTAQVGDTVPTDTADIENYLNMGSLTTATPTNGSLTSVTWSQEPGTNGKFVQGANQGTARLIFNNDPNNYLDVPVTITAGANHVTPTDPGVDPDHPDDQHKDLFMSVTRKVFVNGTEDTGLTQTVRYARDKYTDKDGNVLSYGAWKIGNVENGKWVDTPSATATFGQETVPTETGKDAYVQYGDDASTKTKTNTINAETIPTTTDAQGYVTPQNGTPVYVTYQDNGGSTTPTTDVNVTYTFYDDTANKTVGNPVVVTGNEGQTLPTGLVIPSGYKLAEGQTLPTTVTISGSDEAVTIHLVHATKTVTPGEPGVTPTDPSNPAYKDLFKSVTRTINVVNPITDETEPHEETVEFGRTGVKDDVTGEFLPDQFGAWKVYNTANNTLTDETTGTWNEFDAPEFSGYTPSQAVVEAKTVNAETPDETVTITYSKADNGDHGNGGNTNPTPNPGDNNNNNQGNNGNNGNNNNGNGNGNGNGISNGNGNGNGNGGITTDNNNNGNNGNKAQAKTLPQTGNQSNAASIAGLGLASFMTMLGLSGYKKREDK